MTPTKIRTENTQSPRKPVHVVRKVVTASIAIVAITDIFRAGGSGGSSGAPSQGRSRAGRQSGRPASLLGEQDHQQAAADAVGAVQQAHQVAGVGGWAGGFGVHAGGTHTGGGLVGSLWSQAPTIGEATSSVTGTITSPGWLRRCELTAPESRRRRGWRRRGVAL
jgi:hypothetical protein